VRCERLAAGARAAALAAELRAMVPAPESVAPAVAEIVERVGRGGDAAVAAYTERFDAAPAPPLLVTEAELLAAGGALEREVRRGLELAIANVGAVARAGLRGDRVVGFDRHEVTLREVPVASAAVYVPGGRAAYPSTVVMGVVTARAAGVREVVVCSPPGRGGELSAVVLGACALAGATRVYRMGGAQAIAALALGTDTVPAVEVIVGPGNLYVQEAKRQLSGRVGIDSFAGPSDLVVIAGAGAALEPIGLDLLAQAEHGPGTLVVAVSTSPELLDALAVALRAADDTGAAAALVEVATPEQALALAEAFAPEHLQLVGPDAEQLAPRVTRAGCVFVGAAAATGFGDYVAGSNHVLPTNGAARFASALSSSHFRRVLAEVRIEDATELARAAAPVARAEGFELHARSMEARIRENGGR
jgi:histidinol dehydrogenase